MREVSRANKALIVLLLDQSDGSSDCHVARYANEMLSRLVISCSNGDGFKDHLDICVLGYHTRSDGSPVVAPALQGVLSQKTYVSICDIAENPCRIESSVEVIRDEETGEAISFPVQTPVWVEPLASGIAPLAAALMRATLVVDSWIAQHRTSIPPLVVNVTSGGLGSLNPRPYATKLMGRATTEGSVLLCHDLLLHDMRWLKDLPQLTEDIATLFELSSIVPSAFRREMCIWRGVFTDKDARCFAINGDKSLALELILVLLDEGDRAFPHLTDEQKKFLELLHD